MELFCKEETCEIVKEMVKNFIRWSEIAEDEEMVDEIWNKFIDDPANLRVKFKRLIIAEKINVKNLDVNRTL